MYKIQAWKKSRDGKGWFDLGFLDLNYQFCLFEDGSKFDTLESACIFACTFILAAAMPNIKAVIVEENQKEILTIS